MKARFWK